MLAVLRECQSIAVASREYSTDDCRWHEPRFYASSMHTPLMLLMPLPLLLLFHLYFY